MTGVSEVTVGDIVYDPGSLVKWQHRAPWQSTAVQKYSAHGGEVTCHLRVLQHQVLTLGTVDVVPILGDVHNAGINGTVSLDH